ncbi:hypothetical protein [Microvirga sp. P5_D2]
MNNICSAPQCGTPASTRFGRYCRPHVAQLRRHGAIGQTGITKADLKVYRHIVEARLEKNKDKPLLTQLEARWGAVITYAATVREEARSKPMVRYRREAAIETLRIGNNVKPRDVIEAVMAMYVMQDQEPRRFKNQDRHLLLSDLEPNQSVVTLLLPDLYAVAPKSGSNCFVLISHGSPLFGLIHEVGQQRVAERRTCLRTDVSMPLLALSISV